MSGHLFKDPRIYIYIYIYIYAHTYTIPAHKKKNYTPHVQITDTQNTYS